MRFFIALAFVIALSTSAYSDESSVYRCRFDDDAHRTSLIRMKKYYDTAKGLHLGKVDLLDDDIEKESTRTKVYQIPLQDKEHYMQIWYAASLRVDAQLSYSQGVREFHATYNRNAEKYGLICVELKY